MKNNKIELDVDFIGSQESLTEEEENALHDYFEKRNLASRRRQSKLRSKTSKQVKSTN
ncbi:MAG: hypothetical protein IH594_17885 [Bacteroidales bacterium]|nr:hypothetical protein [Bacteroidales bacterium]